MFALKIWLSHSRRSSVYHLVDIICSSVSLFAHLSGWRGSKLDFLSFSKRFSCTDVSLPGGWMCFVLVCHVTRNMCASHLGCVGADGLNQTGAGFSADFDFVSSLCIGSSLHSCQCIAVEINGPRRICRECLRIVSKAFFCFFFSLLCQCVLPSVQHVCWNPILEFQPE